MGFDLLRCRWLRRAFLPLFVASPVFAAPPSSGSSEGHDQPVEPSEVRVTLSGFLLVNLNYNSATLYPGSQAAWVVRPDVSEHQFFISPQNSLLGINLESGPLHGATVLAQLAITLRSPQPLLTTNTIAPQFYDVHIEAKTKAARLAFGQMPDVVYPVTPAVLNGMPPGYLPGAIGYARPQLAASLDLDLVDDLRLLLQGSLARPVQTFSLSDDLAGRQAGVPDFEGRLGITAGEADAGGPIPLELGLDGHWGRRLVTLLPPDTRTLTFTTWSLGADLRATLPTKTTFRGEAFRGALLGDFQAGVFYSVEPTRLVAVRAWGFWAEMEQRVTDSLRIAITYGLDVPNENDLSPEGRSRNQAVLATGLYDLTNRLGFGLEGSRWQTNFVGLGKSVAWRGDFALFLRFGER